MELLANRLSELRFKKKLSQRDIARQVGITAASLSAYEKGTKTPSLEVAAKLAQAYGVSLDWLCGLVELEAGGKLRTYADLFRLLINLCDANQQSMEIQTKKTPWREDGAVTDDEAEMYLQEETLNEQTGIVSPVCVNHAILDFRSWKTVSFIEAWNTVRTPYLAGTIDEELYNLWIDKRLKEAQDILLPGMEKEKDGDTPET